MKVNNELMFDIIYEKKKSINLYVNELKESIVDLSNTNDMVRNSDIKIKLEEIEYLEKLESKIKESDNCVNYLKSLLKAIKDSRTADNIYIIKFKESQVLKQLLKEYKSEYKKVYSNNRYLGLDGLFDNNLFCEIIRKKINKYTDCNRVTRKKYDHLTAFLNEFLCEMENSNDPLKTLKHKMKLYEKYRKTEYVEILKKQKEKVEIIKDILKEYKSEKNKQRRCV